MLLNIILSKQQNTATERVINQMMNENARGYIWYCDSCEKSTKKPSLDKTCKCGWPLRPIKLDDKNEQYKF